MNDKKIDKYGFIRLPRGEGYSPEYQRGARINMQLKIDLIEKLERTVLAGIYKLLPQEFVDIDAVLTEINDAFIEDAEVLDHVTELNAKRTFERIESGELDAILRSCDYAKDYLEGVARDTARGEDGFEIKLKIKELEV
jgi:succinyl-CoA synthetase beta subunit